MAIVEVPSPKDPEIVESLLLDLLDPENALCKSPKKREMFNDLARLLWYSFGTLAALLQQSSIELSTVAAHPETRTPFLEAAIPLYLFPFLNTTSKAKSFEHLRVTCLGVLGALAKVDDTEVVKFLLESEVIPLCLRIMGTGSELSKTAASVLANMVIALTEQPSTRLLKHVICCYLRLTDDPIACTALQTHLPEALRNGTFDNWLRDDPAARNFLQHCWIIWLVLLAHPSPGSVASAAPHLGPGPSAGRSHGGPSQLGPSRTP